MPMQATGMRHYFTDLPRHTLQADTFRIFSGEARLIVKVYNFNQALNSRILSSYHMESKPFIQSINVS